MKYSIYSTLNAYGEEGEKRCIYENLLKDFQHIYTFEYLLQFFEEKSREYLSRSIDYDEKYYALKKQFSDFDDYTPDFSCVYNYFAVLQVVWIIKNLKLFYDRGYDFKLININSEHNGWIMNFTFDFSNLTKEQIEIIYINAFELNQFAPSKIAI